MAGYVTRNLGKTWPEIRAEGSLLALVDECGGVRPACRVMGWSYNQHIQRAVREERVFAEAQQRSMVAKDVECMDRRFEDPDLIDKLWEAARAASRATEASRIEQDEAAFVVKDNAPIAIAAFGDTHIGADGVNYFDLQTSFDLLEKEPGLYGIINGDMIDGFVSHCPDTGRFGEVIRPKFQKRLAKHVCEKLRGKLLAYNGGQHEFFSSRLDDFDLAEYLALHGDAVYLGPGGTMYLCMEATGLEYSIGCWHEYPGNSMYDNTAGAKRLYRDHGPFDITMVADKHSPAVSMEIRNGSMKTFMRGGTWKLRDDYSKSLGYTDSAVAVPMVIVWPAEKRYWTTIDLDEGISYLRAVRAEYAEREAA